jgi:tetraacyldisaccharide 4'-kinase
MRTPGFWYQPVGLKALALWPISMLYRWGAFLDRWSSKPKSVNVPVICVGNFVAGGAGKTPCVIALAKALKAHGIEVHIISRGYGRRIPKPLRVDLSLHTFQDVGDEPLLLARSAPTWVGKNRYELAKAAIAQGAQLILMDDGFHNYQLKRDMNICVVDGDNPLGNGMTMPSGPLRTPISWVEPSIHAYLQSGEKAIPFKPSYRVQRIVPKDAIKELLRKKIVAFCGIAHPFKFFETIHKLGIELVGQDSYPDHHAFTHQELTGLMKQAHHNQAHLLTTEKDFVRLNAGWQKVVSYLPIEADIEGLETLVAKIIKLQGDLDA